MCLPEIRQKPDGERIVVDRLSGRRYPPGEEAAILAFATLDEEKKLKSQDPPDQTH